MSEMQTMETGSNNQTDTGAESQAPQSLEATADKLYGDQQQQSGEQEQQSTEVSEDNADQDSGEQEAPKGAPEQYEDFKAPEGQQFDKAVIEAYKEAAKELDMPQDAAQKMLDKMAPIVAERQAQRLEAVRSEWAEQSTSDKEFGGEKLSENLGVARKALDSFGSPELKSLLNESGLGNHPEFIRLLYRAGKAISEDNFVGGKGSPSKAKPTSNADFAASLYPSSQ